MVNTSNHSKFVVTFVYSLLLGFPTSGHTNQLNPIIYKVKEGDTLSQILLRLGIQPIYGKKNALEQTLTLNPNKKKSDGNVVRPGENIFLPNLSQAAPQVPAPQPEKEVPTSPNQVAHGYLFGIKYGFLDLMVTDKASSSKAKLYTTSNTAISIGLSQIWNNTFSSTFIFHLEDLNFAPSSNSLKSIKNRNVTKKNFALGIKQNFTPDFSIRYKAGYGSELFVHGIDSSSIGIDSVPLMKTGVDFTNIFFRNGKTLLGLEAKTNYLFGSEAEAYSIKAGHSIGGNAFMSYEGLNNGEYLLSIGYEARSQDSSFLKHKEHLIFASLVYNFSESRRN